MCMGTPVTLLGLQGGGVVFVGSQATAEGGNQREEMNNQHFCFSEDK